jgi:hypothetical protein
MVSTDRSERARRAVLVRWGGRRVVRLDQLTGPQRDLVVALVETMRKAAGEAAPTADSEVRRASATTPTDQL